jgi:EAL domain-containing protein (putative c-di-GMP-specific phosphodiesterase class I)
MRSACASRSTTSAEGVETPAQAEFLRKHVCDEYQGFHFSKPLPAAEMTTLLAAQPLPTLTVEPLSPREHAV